MTSWQSRPSPDFHAPSMKGLRPVSYPMRGQIGSGCYARNSSLGRFQRRRGPMTKQELIAKVQGGQAWIPGKRVKIGFGGDQGAVMLDGAANQVNEDDGAADTTIRVGWDDWQ